MARTTRSRTSSRSRKGPRKNRSLFSARSRWRWQGATPRQTARIPTRSNAAIGADGRRKHGVILARALSCPHMLSAEQLLPRVLLGAGIAGLLAACGSEETLPTGYAGSQRCSPCHEQAYQRWQRSHHALAERPIDLPGDAAAFSGKEPIRHGTLTSHVETANESLRIVTLGGDNKVAP